MDAQSHESDGIRSDAEEDLDQLIDEHEDDKEIEDEDFTEDEDSQMDAIEDKMRQFQSHWRPPLKGSKFPDMESDLVSDHSE